MINLDVVRAQFSFISINHFVIKCSLPFRPFVRLISFDSIESTVGAMAPVAMAAAAAVAVLNGTFV